MTIDEVDSLFVLKFVAVVKQGIEAESRQGITEAGLDLKIKSRNKPFDLCDCAAHVTLDKESSFQMTSIICPDWKSDVWDFQSDEAACLDDKHMTQSCSGVLLPLTIISAVFETKENSCNRTLKYKINFV